MTTRWRVDKHNEEYRVIEPLPSGNAIVIAENLGRGRKLADQIIRDHNDAQGLRKFVQRVADGLLTANIRKEAQAALAQAEQVESKP